MKTEAKKLDNGDLQILIVLDEHDQLCLKNDLIDIDQWFFSGPSSEKIKSCQQRMIEQNKEKLLREHEFQNKTLSEINMILENPRELCKKIASYPWYKNRKQKEDEISLLHE